MNSYPIVDPNGGHLPIYLPDIIQWSVRSIFGCVQKCTFLHAVRPRMFVIGLLINVIKIQMYDAVFSADYKFSGKASATIFPSPIGGLHV